MQFNILRHKSLKLWKTELYLPDSHFYILDTDEVNHTDLNQGLDLG